MCYVRAHKGFHCVLLACVCVYVYVCIQYVHSCVYFSKPNSEARLCATLLLVCGLIRGNSLGAVER